MVKRREECGLRALVSRSLFYLGSEIVGSAELRKRERENKTGGNWEEKGRVTGLSLPSFSLLPAPPPFRVHFTFASSPLSEVWNRLRFSRLRRSETSVAILRSLSDSSPSRLSLLVFGVEDENVKLERRVRA